MKRNDCLLILFLFLLAISSLAGLKYHQQQQTDKLMAVISQNNRVIEKIDLNQVSEAREIAIGGQYQEIVRVEKGRIRFLQADCPDKICVNTGWLSRPGDMAVCLPNRVVVKIELN